MFQLPEQFAVPDILFAEELEAQHAELVQKGLQVKEMDEATVIEAIRLSQRYRKPGQNDINALALAITEECPLLTGDLDLRNAAKKESVDVRGTLWLIQRMYDESLISKEQAKTAYNKMQEAGRRLPWHLVKKQLGKIT